MTLESEGRRSVLIRFVTGGLALMAAGLAGLVGLVAVPPAPAAARRWRRVMPALEVPDNPTPVVLAERHADGWYQTRKQSALFVDRDADGYRVLSATCSHLGCSVRWDPDADHFRCPCHGGAYDREGLVVAGPPPAPLTRLNVRVNPETSDLEVEL